MQLDWNPPMATVHVGRLTYDCGHADLVHEGAYSADRIYPARPWTDAAIAEIDAEREFKAAWDETQSLDESFTSVVQVIAGTSQEMLLDDRWSWPNVTRRQNGSVVGSPRDIFDIGTLYNSLEVEVL